MSMTILLYNIRRDMSQRPFMPNENSTTMTYSVTPAKLTSSITPYSMANLLTS